MLPLYHLLLRTVSEMPLHVAKKAAHLLHLTHTGAPGTVNVKRLPFLNLISLCPTGEQLQINQPNVYDCDIPESLASLVPSLAAVCGKHPSGRSFPPIKTASNRSVTLTSKGGTKFVSFAKGASFDQGRQPSLQFLLYEYTLW